jgi:hypothetical protein
MLAIVLWLLFIYPPFVNVPSHFHLLCPVDTADQDLAIAKLAREVNYRTGGLDSGILVQPLRKKSEETKELLLLLLLLLIRQGLFGTSQQINK